CCYIYEPHHCTDSSLKYRSSAADSANQTVRADNPTKIAIQSRGVDKSLIFTTQANLHRLALADYWIIDRISYYILPHLHNPHPCGITFKKLSFDARICVLLLLSFLPHDQITSAFQDLKRELNQYQTTNDMVKWIEEYYVIGHQRRKIVCAQANQISTSHERKTRFKNGTDTGKYSLAEHMLSSLGLGRIQEGTYEPCNDQ
ncbi:hypothetical protein MXB_3016, partial [Myxobolus squamalis]